MRIPRSMCALVALAALGLGQACESFQQRPRSSPTVRADRAVDRSAPHSHVSTVISRPPERALRADGLGPGVASIYVPTGHRASSVILLEVSGPPEMVKGKPLRYEIAVTNLTSMVLDGVVIRDRGSAELKIDHSSIDADVDAEERVRWRVGSLEPAERKTVTIDARSSTLGAQPFCVTAEYMPFACLETVITDPKLELALEGPAEHVRCDPIIYSATVRNTGSGTARTVVLSADLPEGLQLSDGRNRLAIDVGSLPEGQSRTFKIEARASRTGEFVQSLRATAAGDLSAEASTTTIVHEPKLRLVAVAPTEDYINVPVKYEFALANTGDAPARDTVVVLRLPAGMSLVEASDDGRSSGGAVRWSLGALEPGAGRTLIARLRSNLKDSVTVTATARAWCANEVSASATTFFSGIAGLLLEVVDHQDPIRSGEQEVYDITVTNQGSASATNVRVEALLEERMEYLSADGPTIAKPSGRQITFDPLPELRAGDAVTWRVMVRGTRIGDLRFNVSMRADQLTSAVEESESTRVY